MKLLAELAHRRLLPRRAADAQQRAAEAVEAERRLEGRREMLRALSYGERAPFHSALRAWRARRGGPLTAGELDSMIPMWLLALRRLEEAEDRGA
jgi:hypothetical protein